MVVHLQVNLNEIHLARLARTHVVDTQHLPGLVGDRNHAFADVRRQLAVHQVGNRLLADLPGVVEHVERNSDAEQRVEARPAVHGKHQRQDDTGVGDEVGEVVQCVGLDGRGTCHPDHVTLDHQQHQGGDDGEYHHRDADHRLPEFQRVEQPVDGLKDQEAGRPRDECRLPETGQGLGLAVSEAVFLVCRLEGVANGEQVDHGRERIHGGIHQRRQHCYRTRQQGSRKLGDDEHEGCRHRSSGGQAQELLAALEIHRSVHGIQCLEMGGLPGVHSGIITKKPGLRAGLFTPRGNRTGGHPVMVDCCSAPRRVISNPRRAQSMMPPRRFSTFCTPCCIR